MKKVFKKVYFISAICCVLVCCLLLFVPKNDYKHAKANNLSLFQNARDFNKTETSDFSQINEVKDVKLKSEVHASDIIFIVSISIVVTAYAFLEDPIKNAILKLKTKNKGKNFKKS